MIDFVPNGAALTADLHARAEADMGCILPNDFVQAYISPPALSYPNQFEFMDSEMVGSIATVIPFTDLAREYRAFSKMYNIEGFLPFTNDAGRGFILVSAIKSSPEYGSICFYDCDLGTLERVAENMASFVKRVRCFSLDEILFNERGNGAAVES